jgi:hypothetical protein
MHARRVIRSIIVGLAFAIVATGLGLGARAIGATHIIGRQVPLSLRSPPAPGCQFVCALDRERDDHEVVQFGTIACPGAADAAALRIGAAWFALPDSAISSPYGRIRRTPDNRHWVVFANASRGAEVLRSDDGGRTFARMEALSSDTPVRAWDLDASGDGLEHLSATVELPRSRLAAVWEALTDDPPYGVSKLDDVRMAWSASSAMRWSSVEMVSHDSGRTWAERKPLTR